jgi:predicted CopG family antitoxin
MLTKRLEILLDPDEYKEIQKEAKERGASMGQLVRDVLREKMVKPRKKTAIEAFQKLFSKEMEIDVSSWTEEKKKITKTRIKEIEAY